MARSYEYVIHGPPAAKDEPTKTLSTRRDHRRRDSDLRNLYRDSQSPDEESPEKSEQQPNSNQTTPRLPPTPPTIEDELIEAGIQNDQPDPMTPVLPQNRLPTPDDTPPRAHLKPPTKPFLTMQPSMASTRAESFKTAREDIGSEDEFSPFSPEITTAQSEWHDFPLLNAVLPSKVEKTEEQTHEEEVGPKKAHQEESDIPSSPTLPQEENRHSILTTTDIKDTPQTQFHFDFPVNGIMSHNHVPSTEDAAPLTPLDHTNSTCPIQRSATLRERLKDDSVKASASTEAFANVIGWNDGRGNHSVEPGQTSKRWSVASTVSAVEAYVVESPIKPRKRGTLRKVIKNDSLRSVSSPIPTSNRTSLISTSDSPHRLIHKKQKLNNETRWSQGSDVSKRSLSWGSGSIAPKEVVKVAVIPERRSSLSASTDSNRLPSQVPNVATDLESLMPSVNSQVPKSKQAVFAHGRLALPTQSQSLNTSRSFSALSSVNRSRANSDGSQVLSLKREQAEKDLRTTLDRMESERLSASIRRDSTQSTSPTPAPRSKPQEKDVSDDLPFRKISTADASTTSIRRSVTLDVPRVEPGTKEWADMRPSTISGTPFSQASVMSMSPEIVEAKIVSFFPHNNHSLQLIEPNRLSETPAVKAVMAQHLRRAETLPSRPYNPETPRTSGQNVTNAINTDSPLRNPRKPPQPPQVQLAVIPATPVSSKDVTPFSQPSTQSSTVLRRRPSLQERYRSDSFIKTISRNMSLRTARNPKQHQDLEPSQNPFWRPKAFWDDEEYRKRMESEREDGSTRNIGFIEPLQRSNTIATGPMSLIRRLSERRQHKRAINEHIASQQALVKQTSYSSLQRFNAGRKLYFTPGRTLSLNMGVHRLNSLRQKMITATARREDEKREQRRDKLRKSIGVEVVMTGDSRFPKIEHTGGHKVDHEEAMGQLLANARAEEVVGKRGLRL